MEHKIERETRKIINPVYMVGGSVRDEIMGRPPNDFDFATPLSPDQIEQSIREAGKKPYLIGKKFGTVGVKIDNQLVEITTFRSEKYSPKNRKPEVEFVRDINVDLSRRDFTINAIAKREDHYIDPFNGQNDIKYKIIRTVGNPKERFKEDPLRLLRAARFASQLGFDIENQTIKKMKEMSFSILFVSRERWINELDKILITRKPSFGLNILMETRLINFMIPELSIQFQYDQNSPYHKLDLWSHTLKTVDLSPIDLTTRWSALLHDIAKPYTKTDKKDRSNYVYHDLLGSEMVKHIGHYLKWNKQRIDEVSNVVGNHLKNSIIRDADNAAKE